MPTSLSVIIPVYKGFHVLEQSLPILMPFLEEHFSDFEVIVIDDGSPQQKAIQDLAKHHMCLFGSNQSNQGKGSAVKRGIHLASKDVILFTDADLPFCLSSIVEFCERIENHNVEVVVGDRTLKDSIYYEEVSILRTISSAVFTFLVGQLVAPGVRDTQCGIKAFSAPVARKIFRKVTVAGFAFDVEVLQVVYANQIKIERMPVKLRSNSESTVNVLIHSLEMLHDIIRIKYKSLRGDYRF